VTCRRLAAFLLALGALVSARESAPQPAAERHRLYVATPGIRSDTQYGGVGLLVFDADHGHRWLKRIPTFAVKAGAEPEPVKGIAASAQTRRIYVSTPTRLLCMDLTGEKPLWEKQYEGGCDRMSLSPDGRKLYVPSFEGPHWSVIDALSGELITRIEARSGSHNTICGIGGNYAYLAGLRSPALSVADARTQRIIRTVGPFSSVIRPFTVNGRETLCFVNVNDLLGFEVGDLRTGAKLCRVEVSGYEKGPTKRHGCPSHGIGLTPDERELWLCDSHNSRIHVFDATTMPPKQVASIPLGDQPGWVTFSLDGRYAYPSTGEVIETRSRRAVASLADETGRAVQSEKLLEIDFAGSRPVRAGDQFGLGRVR
jgi:DNA-binding beta-propeller fold protein YncE